jgi:transcriptional regulator with XRE-family HTH domain
MSTNASPAVGGLREQRKAARLSQQRLAEIAGCSISSVRLLENGYQPARGDVLNRVLAALAQSHDMKRPAATPSASTTSPGQDRRHGEV